MKKSDIADILHDARALLEQHPTAAWGPGKAVVVDGQMHRAPQAARFCAAILGRREGRAVKAEIADVEILDGMGWYAEHSDAEITQTRALMRRIVRLTEEA